MQSNVIDNHRSRFLNWITSTSEQKSIIYFTRVFAAIWLVYDIIDVSRSQMLTNFWFLGLQVSPQVVIYTQVTTIVCEVGMLIGYYPRLFALGACLARASFAYRFPMNDYLYFSVTTLILSQYDYAERKTWLRDVLVLQTAWIYFSSAIMKMNPAFLSGGDLYARQNYLAAVLPIPYPAFYRAWIADIHHDAILAWLGIGMELLLPALLLSWWLLPNRRKILRLSAIFLAAGVHLYAAFALNVFFFGASILAQVFFITMD